MLTVFLIPLTFQAVAISIDEFYFHYRRGLSRWERASHPIDSLILLACFCYLIFFPYGDNTRLVYAGLCFVSCVFITKDEWIHNSQCSGFEQWLHSVLFIAHPLVLIAGFYFWHESEWLILKIQATLISIFLIYQVIFWNFYDRGALYEKTRK
jgi:hypothetical protein